MPVSPERLQRAKKVLLTTYGRTGGMPSVAAFAKEMGYSSPASAFKLTEELVAAGSLEPGTPDARVLTKPLTEVLQVVGAAARLGRTGLVLYGNSRNGKSTALAELEDSAFQTKSWVPYRYYSEPYEQGGRAPKFFRGFVSKAKASTSAVRFAVGSELDRLINSIRLACQQMETQRVLLLLDEVQDLPDECLLMLKTLTDRLELQHKLSYFVVCAGTPQLVTRRDELMLETDKRMYNDLVARFFADQHYMRGLKKADFVEVLNAYDEPKSGAVPFAQHQLPALFQGQGWRMAGQLDALWAEFRRVAYDLSKTPDEQLEVATACVFRAAKSILLSLAREPELAGKSSLYQQAVKDSGFATIYVPAGGAEAAAWSRFKAKKERALKRGRA